MVAQLLGAILGAGATYLVAKTVKAKEPYGAQDNQPHTF